MKYLKRNPTFMAFLFGALIFINPDSPTFLSYLSLLIGFVFLIGVYVHKGSGRFSIAMLTYPNNGNKLLPIFWYLSILTIVSWGYGVFLGCLSDAPLGSVFSNFFGLTLYILFPLLVMLNISKAQAGFIVLLAGLVQLALATFSFDAQSISTLLISAATSISDFRSSYSAGYVAILPLICVLLGIGLFNPIKVNFALRIISIFFASVSILLLSFVTASKGFILAIAFVVALVIIRWFMKNLASLLCLSLLVVIIVSWLSFTAPFSSETGNLLIHSYSIEERGNSIRAEQASALSSEFSLLGSGLGVRLRSGYSRDETGYGFELTYLNLLHKMGIGSVPLLMLYCVTLAASVVYLFRSPRLWYPYLCIGSCGFMLVGIGNPILLGPGCVTLNCISMYILAKNS